MPTIGMPQKAIVRQPSITPAAAREGMKVLEKFCRMKYRNSTLLNELEEASVFSPDPTSPPPVPPKDADSAFPFRETEADEEVQESPGFTARVWKYLRVVYRRLGIGNWLLLAVLFTYALLGGFIFLRIERPYEERMVLEAQKEAVRRQNDFARQLQQIFAENNCTSKDAKKTGDCFNVFKSVFVDYDRRSGLDVRTKLPVWKWDAWTSVFYAGTLLTTIGYGNMHCRTVEGRVLTIVYTLVGLPLMLAVLRWLGEKLFNGARASWEAMRRWVDSKWRRFY